VAEGKLYLGEALVEAAKSAEDHTAARRVLKEASTSEDVLRREDRFALHFLLGRTFFNQGRWGEALPHLRRARALIDDNPDMLFLLGRTYRALGDSARAEATMRKHRQVYEDTATVRQFMARINDNPNDAKARLEFARWYARKDIPGGAAIQYEEMMARGLDVETARRELQALEVRGAARP
jgi:Flp pilus assembly protein TadD